MFEHGFSGSDATDFLSIIDDFADSFAETGPPIKTGCHVIRLKDNTPFHVRPYSYNEEKTRIINESVEEMLQKGYIEPSTSPYNSPIVIVNRKNKKPRFCVDYRRLNSITHDESSVLPSITETLRHLGNAKIFSTLDLTAGYWQIPVSEESRPYTAFSTPCGSHYVFKVMPFGLVNAPSTFQKLMTHEVLPGFINRFVFVYLDDIIIYSQTPDDHLRHLRQVFERLQKHGLRCSAEKCTFGKSSLDYLGHRITANGNEPQQEHITRIVNATQPTNRKKMSAFLGLCGWIREYVPNFSEMAAPLTALLSPKIRYTWGPLQEEAFQQVKEAFKQPLHLERPDPTLPYILQTDASKVGLGAVLYQSAADGRRRVIAYGSAKLSPAEQKYHSNEQECLAIVWAIRRYRHYLEDRPFTLRTDNRSLTWLKTLANPNAKLTRWALLLQELKFTVEHCPGKENQLADALSRSPTTEPAEINDELPGDLPEHTIEPRTAELRLNAMETMYDRLLRMQQRDDGARRLAERLIPIQAEDADPAADLENVYFREHYVLKNGIIYSKQPHGEVLLVPPDGAQQLIRSFHDNRTAGHPGIDETIRAISRRYHITDMNKEVRRYIAQCRICAKHKATPHIKPSPFTERPPPARPFEMISVDIMGPYKPTASGLKYIITACDMYSRWVEARATTTSTTTEICNFLYEEVICRYGYPKMILSDNGSQFMSQKYRRTVKLWGAERYTTPVYHPRANPVERRHQELKKQIRILLDGRDETKWAQELPTALFHTRSRRNAATGLSPAAVLLGRELPRPGEWKLNTDVLELDAERSRALREEIHEKQHQYRANYHRNKDRRSREYEIGTEVYARTHPRGPFAPRYEGPARIAVRLGQYTYRIEFPDGRYRKVHIDQLRTQPPARNPELEEEEANESLSEEDEPQYDYESRASSSLHT